MTQLVFFLEEPSARAMLENFLPRILPDNIAVRYVVFEGKQDLDNSSQENCALGVCPTRALWSCATSIARTVARSSAVWLGVAGTRESRTYWSVYCAMNWKTGTLEI